MYRLFYYLIAAALLLASCSGSTSSSASGSDSDSTTTEAARSQITKPNTTFAFTGDIMQGTTWPDSIHGTHLPKDDGVNYFVDAAPILKEADVAAGNCEGTLLDKGGERRPMGNPRSYFVFRQPTKFVNNLVEAGYDFMGIANNHINDFGPTGRKSTCETLEKAGLAHAGLKDKCEIAIVERDGKKIGFTQFGHGMNNLNVNDLDELRRVVKEMKAKCDIVVIAFHGGAEGAAYTHVPHKTETYVGEARGNVEQFAHTAIDEGADIVYGHGPHVVRGAELYKGHIIFYSLGNFCTPFKMGVAGATAEAPIATVEIGPDGKFIKGKIYSLLQAHATGPRLDSHHSAARRIADLSRSDFPTSPLLIDDEGNMSVKK